VGQGTPPYSTPYEFELELVKVNIDNNLIMCVRNHIVCRTRDPLKIRLEVNKNNLFLRSQSSQKPN
jgi:hypothetical protein